MDEAASNDHLNVVKWLHENRTEGCTKKAMDPAGSVEMVEWLHANRSEGCTAVAMDTAAWRGDVDTLLFLHEKYTEGCTVRAGVDACRAGQLDIFQWLCENYPKVMNLEEIQEHVGDDPGGVTFFLADVDRAKRQRTG